jgi:hypothetical protein
MHAFKDGVLAQVLALYTRWVISFVGSIVQLSVVCPIPDLLREVGTCVVCQDGHGTSRSNSEVFKTIQHDKRCAVTKIVLSGLMYTIKKLKTLVTYEISHSLGAYGNCST